MVRKISFFVLVTFIVIQIPCITYAQPTPLHPNLRKLREELPQKATPRITPAGISQKPLIQPAILPTVLPVSPSPFPWLQKIPWETLASFVTILGVCTAWLFAQRKKKNFKFYFEKIDSTYSNFKLNSRRCEAELYRLRDMVEHELKEGKIEEGTFSLLNSRIEVYLKEIRSLILTEQFGALPSSITTTIQHMLTSGDISEKEYQTFVKILENTTGIATEQKNSVEQTIRAWKEHDQKK